MKLVFSANVSVSFEGEFLVPGLVLFLFLFNKLPISWKFYGPRVNSEDFLD